MAVPDSIFTPRHLYTHIIQEFDESSPEIYNLSWVSLSCLSGVEVPLVAMNRPFRSDRYADLTGWVRVKHVDKAGRVEFNIILSGETNNRKHYGD
jgi:hypothetical protein